MKQFFYLSLIKYKSKNFNDFQGFNISDKN